jgi:hypothetical protein
VPLQKLDSTPLPGFLNLPAGPRNRKWRPASSVPGARARLEVPGANIVEQTFCRVFDEIEYVLEITRSAAVGVGYLGLGTRRIVQKGSYNGPSLADFRNHPVVLLVHRQDVVEPPAVFGVEQPRPLGRDVYSAGKQALLRPGVRRLSGGVEAVGAGGVDGNFVGEPSRRATSSKTPCAMGLRQMFPVQTKRIRTIDAILDNREAEIRTG